MKELTELEVYKEMMRVLKQRDVYMYTTIIILLTQTRVTMEDERLAAENFPGQQHLL